ncbi:MAG: hypothetical protein WA738_00770 [Candidatus Angelobacter sp.]
MVETIESGKTCPACSFVIVEAVTICPQCGAVVEPTAASPEELSEEALRVVDPEHRVEVAHFEINHGEEAELACGMLRANGIACELSNPLMPGLPNERTLWVDANNAAKAKILLADAERRGSEETKPDSDAA